MGGCESKGNRAKTGGGGGGRFVANSKSFRSMDQVQLALREGGLESSNLILAVDYTKSNTWTGARSFGGKSLHALDPAMMNPYQKVIDIVSRTLEAFDDDKLIPAYGFGDVTTTDKGVFPFFPDERPCNGVAEVLQRYNEITPHVNMSGPTSFAPIINKAVEVVQRTKQYHILVIVADGQVTSEAATAEAIVRATAFPLSIIVVGVGDGPFDLMKDFDDRLPSRKFDNFCFVDFTEVSTRRNVENFDIEFAVAALQEIPAQFRAVRKLGYC